MGTAIKYRLELEVDELKELRIAYKYFAKAMNQEDYLDEKLLEKLNVAEPHLPSYKKKECTKIATKVRQDKAKKKIQNAINLMKLEGKKLTLYSIAKESGVAYQTVKKYITINEVN